MIYAVMLVTFGERLGSILRFSDFEILDLEIFGWSFHIVIVDLPYTTTPESKYGYATSQATKKVQNLNMSAPPSADEPKIYNFSGIRLGYAFENTVRYLRT